MDTDFEDFVLLEGDSEPPPAQNEWLTMYHTCVKPTLLEVWGELVDLFLQPQHSWLNSGASGSLV